MQSVDHVALDRALPMKKKPKISKGVALLIVGIMIASAIAVSLPAVLQTGDNHDQEQINIKANSGQREATYKVDHMFEMYMKDEHYLKSQHANGVGVKASELGHHNTTMGVMDWLNDTSAGIGQSYRNFKYSEMTLRENYPYLFYNDPYALCNPSQPIGLITWAPFRLTIDVKNETKVGTGTATAPKDPIFVPHLGDPSVGGGYINISWYGTYMSQADLEAINSGTYFANWFYDVPAPVVDPNYGITIDPGTNDGYYYEMHGTVNYSSQALIAYLGWDGVTDARDWWNASAGGVAAMWEWDMNTGWLMTGSSGGQYDIFTGYEYDIQGAGAYAEFLKMDLLNSTSDTLLIRVYTLSWGVDALIQRFIEAANITGSFGTSDSMYWDGSTRPTNRGPFQDYGEDMYLNVSISPNMMNASYRQTCLYHMTAWEDPSSGVFSPAWMIEIMHLDYVGNVDSPFPHNSYTSPFDRYDPNRYDNLLIPQITRLSLSPGTTHYDKNVSYWITPVARNLSQYETVIVSLDTYGRDVIGIKPYRAANDNLVTKKAELRGNFTWGRLSLGDGNFPRTEIRNAYDKQAKEIRLVGPMDMSLAFNTDYWFDSVVMGDRMLTHGAPMFILDVVPVDHYDVEVTGPHMIGTMDQVRVIAKNATGHTVTSWNGTVNLDCTDADGVLDATSHAYDPSKNGGIWITNVTWGSAAGTYWVNATDATWTLDILGTSGPIPVILVPEFATLIIPIVGIMAIFLVMRARKKEN